MFLFFGSLPAILTYVIFVIYPIFRSFGYGFYEWNGLSDPKYIGLRNFLEILQDPVFWKSFRNNILVVLVSVFGQLPIGLVLAVLLHRSFKGSGAYRSIFFIPMILSTVVVALLWSSLLNPQVGVVNHFLKRVGMGFLALNWLGDMRTAMPIVCGVIIWQFTGLYMVIFLSALQNIPKEIHEACSLDGVSERSKLIHVTLPLLWPTVMASVVLCIAGSMRSFDLVFVMTEGGPAHATELMATYMYSKTFAVYKYGYGSAISMVIFLLSFGMILAGQALMKRKQDVL